MNEDQPSHPVNRRTVSYVRHDAGAAPGTYPRPVPHDGCPAMTEDGRPFVRDAKEADDELALWMPEPPRDGDPVYCCGVRVGAFSGDRSKPGEWHISTVETKYMPAKLAAHIRGLAAYKRGAK